MPPGRQVSPAEFNVKAAAAAGEPETRPTTEYAVVVGLHSPVRWVWHWVRVDTRPVITMMRSELCLITALLPHQSGRFISASMKPTPPVLSEEARLLEARLRNALAAMHRRYDALDKLTGKTAAERLAVS